MSNETTGSVEAVQNIFNTWFTKEELEEMEKKWNELRESNTKGS